MNMKTIPMTKPISPIRAIPKAETLAIVQNSFLLGFFVTFQTRTHFDKKLFKDII
jgi:hypothetical protein